MKAGGIIQLKSEGLRKRGALGINPSLRAGEDKMSQLNSTAEKKGKFLLPPLFYSGP